MIPRRGDQYFPVKIGSLWIEEGVKHCLIIYGFSSDNGLYSASPLFIMFMLLLNPFIILNQISAWVASYKSVAYKK